MISYRKSMYTISGISMVAMLSCFSVLSAMSAFAATGNVETTASWRTPTLDEAAKLKVVHQDFGIEANAVSNPAGASGVSPGWVPNGYETPAPDGANFSSIILELPRVDLSCSPSVSINISGIGEIVNGTSPSEDGMLQALIIDNSYEASVFEGGYGGFQATHISSNLFELNESFTVNPGSVAFGNLVVLSSKTWGDNGETFEWDIHDVQVGYEYDDDEGDCTEAPAGNQVTSCGEDYLNTAGVAVDEPTRTQMESMLGHPTLNFQEDPSRIRSTEGVELNPALNESGGFDQSRLVELKIVPQAPLLQAGIVQLQLQYTFETPNLDSYVYAMFLTGTGDFAPWSVVGTPFQISGTRTVTAYLPSDELDEVRMLFYIPTIDMGNQITSTISNVSATVTQLGPASVCGISLTSNEPEPPATTTVPPPTTAPATTLPRSNVPATTSPRIDVQNPTEEVPTQEIGIIDAEDSGLSQGVVGNTRTEVENKGAAPIVEEGAKPFHILGLFSVTGIAFIMLVIISLAFIIFGYMLHRKNINSC